MGINLSLEKFSLNKFWEKTPTVLKYILIVAIFIVTFYFFFSKRMDNYHLSEIDSMKKGIDATYELIDNFETFRQEQDQYNKEVLTYLQNLHSLVSELNISTNRKLDMILKSGNKNASDLVEKLTLLNESFEKLSNAYQESIKKEPNLENLEIGVRKNNK
jgi:hypothetical protein